MIRFQCPNCDKRLSVGDDKEGRIAVCPVCKTRIIIPRLEPPPDAVTAEPPRRRRPPPDYDEPPPPRRSRRPPPDEDDLPEAEFDRPRRRKKKKRRRKASSMPLGMEPFWLALIGLVVITLPVIGLTFAFPPIAILPAGIGWLASLAGGVWLLVIAFQDDVTQGLLCLCLPCYSLIYVIQNFEETKRPFFLNLVGVGISVLANIAMAGAVAQH